MSKVQFKAISSLEKIFINSDFSQMQFDRFSMLKNERSSFQIAYKTDEQAEASLEIVSPVAEYISAFEVGLIPAGTTAPKNSDDYYITKEKGGEFPEILYPVSNGKVTLKSDGAYAFWFEIKADGELPAGKHNVTVNLNANGETLASASITVEVINANLPKQTLIFTNWFHTDCLALHYNVEIFSEEYWRIVENYLKRAREFGMNMALTPLFTPPLDTKVGGERPTVQLVDVTLEGRNKYSFGFEKFDRWIEMCKRCEIDYFEMSHFFTQWGAKHAPKIVAKTESGEKKIFGWKTRAAGSKYKKFMHQFSEVFLAHLNELGIKDKCVFHVSDEPNKAQLRSYKKASALVHDCFPDCRFVDALSDFEFYERKLVDTPIPANDHIKPFIDNVPELWTYYCCVQTNDYVSNRFFSMPSQRNRVLGYQLYKFNAVGFLHWGFNFWFKQFSLGQIDPFKITDAGGGFSSGDSFVVYPAKNGTPYNSLRLNVFYDAFQDMMALQLLESKIGREKTIALLEEDAEMPITFNDYPHSSEWHLATREKINKAIAEN